MTGGYPSINPFGSVQDYAGLRQFFWGKDIRYG
jgi:hypothetical protein